jgi:hypothetical protein
MGRGFAERALQLDEHYLQKFRSSLTLGVLIWSSAPSKLLRERSKEATPTPWALSIR